jgi:hypothetical protein
LVVCPLLSCGKLGKDSYFHLLGSCVGKIEKQHFTQMVMEEALMIRGGMSRDQVSQKFIYFGAVNVFQFTKYGVTK